MKARVVAAAAIPALVVLAGLWVIIGTPDVVTIVQQESHSHFVGIVLVMIGLLGCLVAGVVASD